MIDKLKRDTEINWNKAVNFIPKKDEIIVYDCENGPRFKIGDGVTRVIDLNFQDSATSDIMSIIDISDKESAVEDDTLIIKQGGN